MKYSLRSLMIAGLLGPPLLAGLFFAAQWFSLPSDQFEINLRTGTDLVWDSSWDLPYETGDGADSNGLCD